MYTALHAYILLRNEKWSQLELNYQRKEGDNLNSILELQNVLEFELWRLILLAVYEIHARMVAPLCW